MSKLIAKVVVGSQLHETATSESDWDYRGIFVDDLKEALSPFRNHKTTSWIEGDEDNTSYELREFCKLATKGNASIIEVFFSDKIIETSPLHQEMRENWQKFMDTHHFINASRGYAHNQYKKALSYDDLGERQQIRTAKFVIAFLRVLWQCEQYLLSDTFKCSLKTCDMYDFIKSIKGTPREELDIPLCFAKMEEMDKRLLKAEQWCKENTPEVYNRKPDIEWIENFILRAYNEESNQTNAGSTQANDELLKNAIVITKRAHKIWDKVEKYRCKLVYGLDLGVPVLNEDDIEDINIALQEYSGVLIDAVFNLTGKYIPHVSDYKRSSK